MAWYQADGKEHLLNGARVVQEEERDVEEAGPSGASELPQSFTFKRLLRFIGPGLDPGNLESDLQTGAHTGYVLLWLLLLTTFLGFLVQLQSAKLGVATGKHLAQHCREQYPYVPRLMLWVMAEVAIVGSDIQEVIGSAIAILLLSGGRIPLWAGVLITAVDAFLLLFLERIGVRLLEGLFAFFIGVMVVTFGIMFAQADVPLGDVARGFLVPMLPRKDVHTAVALVGSLIMPHNIYLHSALVLSRKEYMATQTRKKEAVVYFGIESAFSLTMAVFINLFVVAVFARGFYGRDDVPEIGLENAGQYLGETYGQAIVFIWALGLLAAGQSSTMTGTYTGQFVMDGYLKLKVSPWFRILITRAFALVPTLAMAVLYRNNSQEMDWLNQALNLLQSIQLPFALVPLLLFTATPSIMGASFVSSAFTSALTWTIAMCVVAINAWAVYEATANSAALQASLALRLVVLAVVVAYLIFLAYLVASHLYRRSKGHAPLSSELGPGLEPTANGDQRLRGSDGAVGHEGEDGAGLTAPLLHELVLVEAAPAPAKGAGPGKGKGGHHPVAVENGA